MDVHELMARAVPLQNKGELGAAEEYYRQAIGRRARNDEAHYLLAGLHYQAGKIDQAVASIGVAIDISPRKAIYFNFLGVCYLLRKEAAAAELSFRHAIELQPDCADAYNNLGLTLLNKKRFDEAYPVLTHALTLAPADVNTLCNLARVLQEREEIDAALDLYERAHVLQPRNVQPLLGKVACLHKLNRYAEALAIIDTVPALDPSKKAEALRQKAVLLGITGDIERACDTFDQALAAAPDSIDIIHARAQIRKVDATEPFFAHLQKLATRVNELTGRSGAQLCYALGKGYQDVGDIASAAKYYALGGLALLQTEEYDEKNEDTLLSAIKQNMTRSNVKKLSGDSSPSCRPIFILGMERSGTTLIEQILASHPDVFAGGELNYFSEVMAGFRLTDSLQLTVTKKETFGPDTSLRERAERYLQKIDAMPGSAGFARITDKMPGNFKNIGFIRALFPEAKIIHCRRDPIDNCISSYSTLFVNGTQWSFDLAAMGRRYRAYWDLMAHWRRELGGQFLELRYEQVIEDTESEARRLLEWCELPWDERVMRFYETNRPVQTASVTQVRQPIYKSSMGRWKQWEPYIQPLLAEVMDIENQYWAELE